MILRGFFIFCWYMLLACSAAPSEAQTVYITKTGKKYHEESCRYLQKSKIELELDKVLELGYDACSVCNPTTDIKVEDEEQPPIAEETSAPAKKPASGSSAPKQTEKAGTSAQCTARTQAGSRCKRTTTAANAKCWQHQ